MKPILSLLLLLNALTSFSQNAGDNEISLNADYAKVQLKLYNIANAGSTYALQQIESFTALKEFITTYPANEKSLYLLAAAVNQTLPAMDSLISLLDTSLNRSPYKASVNLTRKRISLTETGKLFPAYNLMDTSGITTTIESLRGKTVLLDFWSSWCTPCRAQLPDLIKIYAAYKSKGFETIGISMDDNKSSWLNAVAKDSQPWPQFCELVNWRENKTASYFNIHGIPSNFLLDKNGIIIGQDLSPDQVERLLSEL